MLEGIKDVMLLCVSHYVVDHNVLEELAANTGQTYGPVIHCKRLLALLIGRHYIGIPPVIRHHTRLIGPVKDDSQDWRDGRGKLL